MRILLVAHGSRGDIQPLLQVGVALRERGHEIVACLGEPDFRSVIEQRGVKHAPIGRQRDVSAESDTVFVQARDACTNASFMDEMKLAVSFYRGAIEFALDRARPWVEGCDAVIAGQGTLTLGAQTWAEKVGLPFVVLCSGGLTLRSAEYPPYLLGRYPILHHEWPLHRWVNRGLWRFADAILDRGLLEPLNRHRREMGLPQLRKVRTPVELADLVVVPHDPEIAPIARDVRSGVHQTSFLDSPWNPEPLSPELEAFLARHSRVVYVGFGSMTNHAAAASSRIALEAVRKLGCAVVLAAGSALDLAGIDLPSHAFVAGEVDHETLFPRLAAVIHHGGAGTTGTAARAGVPQFVVAHTGIDQLYMARQVERTGVGPRPIRSDQLTEERFSSGLRTALENPTIRRTAEEVGRRIRARRGLSHSVDLIDRFLPRVSTPD